MQHNRKDILEQLTRFVRGELSEEEAEELRRQLMADPELADLSETMDSLQEEAGESWRLPARRLFEKVLRDVQAARHTTDVQRGVLTYDSRVMPAPEGVRPAAVEQGKLKYRIGEWQVELSVMPISPGANEIVGRLIDCPVDASVTLRLQIGRHVLSVTTNRFHIFRFERVPGGNGLLRITSGETALAELELEI